MKNALITGGSRGIGLAIAKELGTNGYRVGIMATKPEEHYPDSSRALKEAGGSYCWFSGNIADTEDRKRVAGQAAEAFGDIHVLVNNAGVAPRVRGDILTMSEENYDYVMDTNTKGNMFMTQLIARKMIEQELCGGRRGTIINISSCSAETVSIDRGEYCVSKAGISMLTKLYAARLAREQIYVYEIRPGVIQTDMTSKAKEKYDGLIGEGIFPIARWGMPEDVARAVMAFCSDDFCYTTGNYIDVDGGFHIRQL